MSVVDTYKQLKTSAKDEMFIELFELKRQKKSLDDRIKKIESIYKPELKGLKHDLFYKLSNGMKFSIKCSQRAGNIDTDRLEHDGIIIDNYRKEPTTVYTLRVDNEG